MAESQAIHDESEDSSAGIQRVADRPPRKHSPRAHMLHVGASTVTVATLRPHVDFRGSIGVEAAVRQPAALWRSERLNRALNVLIAATSVVLLAPALLLIALVVWATSRGPIIYTQIRVGLDQRFDSDRRAQHDRRSGRDRRGGGDRRLHDDRRSPDGRRSPRPIPPDGRRREDIGGQPFRIYKFRTMCVDAEGRSGAVWASRNDARVTPVGRVLRRCRLDELPQLINVLKGEMNIVGPRPERPSIFCRLREEIPEYPLRQRTRPGITGWAQIRQAYDTCLEDARNKVRLDLEYLQRRNLLEDIKIMVKTVPVMLFRRGGW